MDESIRPRTPADQPPDDQAAREAEHQRAQAIHRREDDARFREQVKMQDAVGWPL